jgi:hypothetical protein
MWGGADSQEVGSEAATLERVRNSSLVECPRADNGPGLKPRTEAVDFSRVPGVGCRVSGGAETSSPGTRDPRPGTRGEW